MGDPQFLYDKFTLKFKNNRWRVFILIAFASAETHPEVKGIPRAASLSYRSGLAAT